MVLLFSLVGGLAIALTLQLLLANLGVALGLTLLNFSPAKSSEAKDSEGSASNSESLSEPSPDGRVSASRSLSLPLTNILGAVVALSAITAVFAAALVATEFSTITELPRGIILSLMAWALYWFLFLWLSTTTLSNVVESLVGTAVAGGRELLALVKQVASSAPPEDSDDSADAMLKALSAELQGELSQIANAQKALPQLLEKHREKLIEEVCDRTRLSQQQAERVLSDLRAQSPATSTSAATTVETVTPSVESPGLIQSIGSQIKSNVLSAVESQLDSSNWQEVSRKIIKNVDLSDIESFFTSASRKSSFIDSSSVEEDASKENVAEENVAEEKYPEEPYLEEREDAKEKERPEAQTATAQASEKQVGYAQSAIPQPPSSEVSLLETEQASEEQNYAIASKAIQKKLIAYCRYTNSATLTPESLLEKIETQQAEWAVDSLDTLDLNADAIATVITKRKTLSKAEKEALIDTLETAIAKPSEPALPYALPAPSEQPDQTFFASVIDQTKDNIAHYLHAQEKANLQPKQIAHDLTRIVGSSLQSIPHPSQLPDLSQVKALWNLSTWRQVLEKRKDMTTHEIQQVLGWVESSWEPVNHQTDVWLQALQTEASQLLDVPEELLDETRAQIVEQFEVAKEKVEDQAITLKTELQIQADSVRKQSAIAAWWLFISILLSGLASSGAGWLAIRYV